LKEDSEKLAAEDLHELMRCWENIHRMWQAEAHVRTILFREETRWPGYYYRADTPKIDNDNWLKFANIKWDPKTGEWSAFTKDIIHIF
jgi:adenylylsulfate reductase subunit A